MARVKSVLKRLEVVAVKTRRTCKNSGKRMKSGELCLVVHDGMTDKAPYCAQVARQMIHEARERLNALEEELEAVLT